MWQGYIEDSDSRRNTLDIKNYLSLNGDFSDGSQFYFELPNVIRKNNIFYLLKIIFNNDMGVILQEDHILFYSDSNFINLEKGTMKPILYHNKDEKTGEFITTYFSLELNCVDELKI